MTWFNERNICPYELLCPDGSVNWACRADMAWFYWTITAGSQRWTPPLGGTKGKPCPLKVGASVLCWLPWWTQTHSRWRHQDSHDADRPGPKPSLCVSSRPACARPDVHPRRYGSSVERLSLHEFPPQLMDVSRSWYCSERFTGEGHVVTWSWLQLRHYDLTQMNCTEFLCIFCRRNILIHWVKAKGHLQPTGEIISTEEGQ